MKSNSLQYVALATIFLVAALLRFSGLAWDGGYLFHPDERKIVLVASQLTWPSSVPDFLSSESPLNPRFFAYGTFPIYLLRALSALAPSGPFDVPWRQDSFVALGMLGRVLSGCFDLGTIGLVFLLVRRLYNARIGLVASTCIAVTVLHIQLSHFYAVDTLLTFLVTATLFFSARYAQGGKRRDMIGTALMLGLAMATKVTAAPLVVPVIVAVVRASKGIGSETSQGNRVNSRAAITPRLEPVLETGDNRAVHRSFVSTFSLLNPGIAGLRVGLKVLDHTFETARDWSREIWQVRRVLAQILLIAFAAFVITQPYAVLDPAQYIGQVGTEALVARGWFDYPYTRQYANTLPFIYQIVQSSVWGMGLPLGLATWAGGALFALQWWRKREWRDGFVLSWVCVYFLTIGGQYAKYLRYLLPMLPFLFVMAAAAIDRVGSRISGGMARMAYRFAMLGIGLATVLYAIAYVGMETREHPWLQVSRWIYQNVPANSTIALEHWDDMLPDPLRIGAQVYEPTRYNYRTMPMYDVDDTVKLKTLAEILASSDYVVLASQRLYATISRLPARYPLSSQYYRLLFSGKLGFDFVDVARNDITIGNIVIMNDTFANTGIAVPPLLALDEQGAIVWNWGRADESFAVYDHPMPMVFKKTRALSSAELSVLLSSP